MGHSMCHLCAMECLQTDRNRARNLRYTLMSHGFLGHGRKLIIEGVDGTGGVLAQVRLDLGVGVLAGLRSGGYAGR
jgi:hypothetical protein